MLKALIVFGCLAAIPVAAQQFDSEIMQSIMTQTEQQRNGAMYQLAIAQRDNNRLTEEIKRLKEELGKVKESGICH